MSTLMFIGLFALLLVIIGLLGFILHKVRRIYYSTFQLRDDTKHARSEAEVLFSQVQALLALERRLGLPKALPPMRGWAGSPDFLLAVAEEILSHKPFTILECSSGVSTIVVARCLQIIGAGHVYSLEHERDFAIKTSKLLASYGLSEWATVLDAPLVELPDGARWYSQASIPTELPLAELLIVDGPPASVGALARYPALPRLVSRLTPDITIFVDDADRADEREMVRQWCREYRGLRETRIDCEKGLAILRGEVGAA